MWCDDSLLHRESYSNVSPSTTTALFSHVYCQTDTVPSLGRTHASDRLVPTILQAAPESANCSMEDGSHLRSHLLWVGGR